VWGVLSGSFFLLRVWGGCCSCFSTVVSFVLRFCLFCFVVFGFLVGFVWRFCSEEIFLGQKLPKPSSLLRDQRELSTISYPLVPPVSPFRQLVPPAPNPMFLCHTRTRTWPLPVFLAGVRRRTVASTSPFFPSLNILTLPCPANHSTQYPNLFSVPLILTVTSFTPTGPIKTFSQ